MPPTITFLPAAGQDFRIFITPVWPADNPPAGYNSSHAIRAMVENSAGALQKSAAEERLEIQPIDDVTGFYFPPPMPRWSAGRRRRASTGI